MSKQEVYIMTHVSQGTVKQIDRTVIIQPAIKFKGGSIKWYEDKRRG